MVMNEYSINTGRLDFTVTGETVETAYNIVDPKDTTFRFQQ